MSVSNPGERQTKGRRAGLQAIWNSKEWKDKKKAFLDKNPVCAMCGARSTVPHHPTRESYKGHYGDLELSQCVAYCNVCHFSVHHGLKLCVKCKEHYHPWDAPECRYCFDKEHPEIVEARKKYVEEKEREEKERKDAQNAKNRAAKRNHPCKHRRINGGCGKSMLGTRCAYSPTKAADKCGDFEAKKGK